MPGEPSADEIWNDLVEDLCDGAKWFAGPRMQPAAYRDCMVALATKRLARFGLELLTQIADDGTVWLHICTRDGPCLATFKANPTTGDVTIQ